MFEAVEKWKDNIPYQSILLSVCCGVAAALLAVVHYYTEPVIQLRLEEDQNALLSEVLAGAPFANKVFEHEREAEFAGQTYLVYEVKDAEQVTTHFVIKGGEEGYSGTIQYLVGVDIQGEIKGVRIISHTETPGLGDKIETAKSDWVLSFNGRSLSNTPVWGVKKDGGDFDQFSGATITPRSVVRGVHKAMQALKKDKESQDE